MIHLVVLNNHTTYTYTTPPRLLFMLTVRIDHILPIESVGGGEAILLIGKPVFSSGETALSGGDTALDDDVIV